MQQSSKNISAIGMALYFSAISLGASLTAVSKSFATGSGKIPMLAHLTGVFVVALGLSLFLRQKSARAIVHSPFRFVPALLVAVALFCLVSPYFFSVQGVVTWQSLLPPALAMCLFFPVGIYAFFTTLPRERHGLYFGLAAGVGELVWVTVLPLLYLIAPDFNEPEPVLYMLRLLGFVMAGVGICFAVTLRGAAVTAGNVASPVHSAGKREKHAAAPGSPSVLLPFFGAGIVYCALFGMALLDLPKASDSPQIYGFVHFFLVLSSPLAGAFLDRAMNTPEKMPREHLFRWYFLVLLGACMFVAPVVGYLTKFGPGGILPTLLLAGRQLVFLATLVLTARFAGNSPYFPLIGSCVWGLMLFHLPGILLGQVLAPYPAARLSAMLLLTACALVCLWRGTIALNARFETAVLVIADQGKRNMGEPAVGTVSLQDEEAKLTTFAAAFNLTRRESEVMACIVREVPKEEIGRELGISESTIRFHQTGLLRKTNMTTKRRLAQFYCTWKAE